MKKEDPELPYYDSSGSNDNENNEILDDEEFDEIYGNEDPGIDFEPDDDFGIEHCSMSELIFNFMKMPKPLGFFMPQEKMEEFLKVRGYKIIKRYSDSHEEEYSVAIKPGSSYIPENDYSNVREVFDEQVQEILLKWLLKIGKED